MKKIFKNIDVFVSKIDISDKKVVFTNGCFDILHLGHLRLLKKASQMGDVLVLGLNTDTSIKILKGEERPINNQNYRSEMLEYFDFIDYIILFENETPLELIIKLKPDILVKGGDYKEEEIVGHEFIKRNKGKVVVFDLLEGLSSTSILNKIKNK
tara:strand:+ start:23970 stop:24434 length:465 start_codon:yes stop_codon:yes gene_type:complete